MHHVVCEPTPRRVCHSQHRRAEPGVGASDGDACRKSSELRGHQEGVLVPDALEPPGLDLFFSLFVFPPITTERRKKKKKRTEKDYKETEEKKKWKQEKEAEKSKIGENMMEKNQRQKIYDVLRVGECSGCVCARA